MIGYPDVGKTTITNLIRSQEIPIKHTPTLNVDIGTLKIGKIYLEIWDYTGQEQFSFLWEEFIKGSNLILIVTDSTLENVEKSKFFLEIVKSQSTQANIVVIGNKQDLDNALEPDQIKKILGLKTYPLIALDQEYREKIIGIILQ